MESISTSVFLMFLCTLVFVGVIWRKFENEAKAAEWIRADAHVGFSHILWTKNKDPFSTWQKGKVIITAVKFNYEDELWIQYDHADYETYYTALDNTCTAKEFYNKFIK